MLFNDFCFTDICLFKAFLVLVLKISRTTFYTCNCGNLVFLHVFSVTGLQHSLVAVGLQLGNFILILIM